MNFDNNFLSIIDINGLGCPNDTSLLLQKYPYWIQMYVPQTIYIPPYKPDIKEINSVNIHINILKTKVIKTPICSKNLEGKISTGRKLIIEGQLCEKVVYTALNDVKSVHSANFYIPFSSYIIIPKIINFNKEEIDSLYVNYQVDACVEDFSITKIDNKCLLNNVTLLLYAIPT